MYLPPLSYTSFLLFCSLFSTAAFSTLNDQTHIAVYCPLFNQIKPNLKPQLKPLNTFFGSRVFTGTL